jgi:integrase
VRLTRLGETRALVYLFAVGTGLRKGELRRLRWCDVDLGRGRVTVTAASAKSRRVQTVDLHERLVAALKAAGIARQTEDGRVIDMHALRTTFVSWLAMTGAHPKSAEALARHASFEATMERYTDFTLVNLKGAVDRLPLPQANDVTKRAAPLRVWSGRGGNAAVGT